jgi:MFS family permease
MQLFNILQDDVEPLPEPWRTIFLVLTLLSVLVIPIFACVITMIRRNTTKRHVMEMGSSWKDVDARISKPEDLMLDALPFFAGLVLIIFVGIIVVLMLIIGPVVRDIAIVILMGLTILFFILLCPIMMIWSVRVEDRRNEERIQLAEEDRRLRETGRLEGTKT